LFGLRVDVGFLKRKHFERLDRASTEITTASLMAEPLTFMKFLYRRPPFRLENL
jgi:hypothetical protein